MKRHLLLFFWPCFAWCGDFYAEASNDFFVPEAIRDIPSDGQYTHGTFFSYSDLYSKNVMIERSLQQDIFTPSGANKSADQAVVGDRPFSGFLAAGFNIAQKGGRSAKGWHWDYSQRLGARVGLIGRSALGGFSQNTTHEILEIDTYDAWDDQLSSQFAYTLEYEIAPKIRYSSFVWDYEFAPHLIYSHSNVFDFYGYGATVRMGRRLSQNFAQHSFANHIHSNPIFSQTRYSWDVYAGVERRNTSKNYTLTGTTRQTNVQTLSSSDMIKTTTNYRVGGTLRFGRLGFYASYINQGKEFVQQPERHEFMRLGISLRY